MRSRESVQLYYLIMLFSPISAQNPCTNHGCQNGGQCTGFPGSCTQYYCTCPPCYYGQFCQNRKLCNCNNRNISLFCFFNAFAIYTSDTTGIIFSNIKNWDRISFLRAFYTHDDNQRAIFIILKTKLLGCLTDLLTKFVRCIKVYTQPFKWRYIY